MPLPANSSQMSGHTLELYQLVPACRGEARRRPGFILVNYYINIETTVPRP